MAKASGTRERRHPAEVPQLSRTADGALTPDDITRVLTDASPAWDHLREKLDRFRYCESCDSWRSSVASVNRSRPFRMLDLRLDGPASLSRAGPVGRGLSRPGPR
jgi:hypothetical protein